MQGYVVLHRPYGLLQWVQRYADKLAEDYILMAEPDHLFLKLPPLWCTWMAISSSFLLLDRLPGSFEFSAPVRHLSCPCISCNTTSTVSQAQQIIANPVFGMSR